MEVNDYKENYGSGWIKLHRSIKNHWLFNNDKFFKWWVILLIEVNHKDNKIQLGYNLHEIKRGQSAKSLRSWAKLFNSEVKQVVKFFDLLESDNMIKREILGKGKQSTTLINIENYSTYQGSSETQETTQRTTREPRNEPRERGTNNNDNKDNNVKNEIIGKVKPSHIAPFLSWLEYRKQIKKPIKAEKTLVALVDKFNKRSVDCCDWVVTHSIENQYQGLIWDKYTEQKSRTKPNIPL